MKKNFFRLFVFTYSAPCHDGFWKPWWLFQLFSLKRSKSTVNTVELFQHIRNFTPFSAFHIHSVYFHQIPACCSANQSHSILICDEAKGQKKAKRVGKKVAKKREALDLLPVWGSLVCLEGKSCNIYESNSSNTSSINLFLASLGGVLV